MLPSVEGRSVPGGTLSVRGHDQPLGADGLEASLKARG